MITKRKFTKEESMKIDARSRFIIFGFAIAVLMLGVAAPAEAQREWQPLFDKFSLTGELSWVGLQTEIGLFHEELDVGGTLKFEDDLNLGKNQTIPSLNFGWQISKRHRLALRWQDLSRNSNAQALTDIEWGDETIPVDADIRLSFGTTQVFIDYAYFPWVKDRWAAGFGLGLRWLDLAATLSWTLDTGVTDEGTQKADVAAPVPYLYFEYRRLLSDNWRMILGLGWLEITIEDISGGQYIGKASFEYLLGKRWAVGAGVNYAAIDVEWKGIDDDDGLGTLRADIVMDVWDLSVFGRVRF
jgi:hypothetical protein